MENCIEISEVVKIRDVSAIWQSVEDMDKPVTVTLDKVTEFDAAGMQLIIHLLNLNSNKPEQYVISGLNDSLMEKLINYGYRPSNKKE